MYLRDFIIFKLVFYVAGFDADLVLENMKAFNEEFILVSQRLGRVIFSLVLAVQCLVFVIGVLILAASASRRAFFLFVGVDSWRHAALLVVVAADSESQSADRTQSVDTAAVKNLLHGLTEVQCERRQITSWSSSDIVSLTALRLFTETKV